LSLSIFFNSSTETPHRVPVSPSAPYVSTCVYPILETEVNTSLGFCVSSSRSVNSCKPTFLNGDPDGFSRKSHDIKFGMVNPLANPSHMRRRKFLLDCAMFF